MPKWLDTLTGKPSPETDPEGPDRTVQELRLELAGQDRTIAALRDELERVRGRADSQVRDRFEARIEQMLADAATPVAQLVTLAHLARSGGREVRTQDVLAAAGRLVRVMEDHGLQLVGEIGDRAPFDPGQHEALAAGDGPRPGEPVVLRAPGIAYGGRLLRKASVEKAGS